MMDINKEFKTISQANLNKNLLAVNKGHFKEVKWLGRLWRAIKSCFLSGLGFEDCQSIKVAQAISHLAKNNKLNTDQKNQLINKLHQLKNKVKKSVNKTSIEAAIQTINTEYPLLKTPHIINKEELPKHILLQNKEIKSSKSYHNAEELLHIFKNINFTHPDQPGYYDPSQLPQGMSIEKAREGLLKFAQFIDQSSYDPIHIYVQDYLSTIIEKLVFLPEDEKVKILIDFAHSGDHYCPANQRATIQQALLEVTNQAQFQADQPLEDSLKHLKTQFKRSIFYQISATLLKERTIHKLMLFAYSLLGYYPSQIYKDDGMSALEAHDLNYCLDLIGQECEMPGVELSREDWIAKHMKKDNPHHPARAKQLFAEKYTRKNLIKAICEQINAAGNPPIDHSILFDWFKNHSSNGINDDYSNILDEETLSKYKFEAIELMLDKHNLLAEFAKK